MWVNIFLKKSKGRIFCSVWLKKLGLLRKRRLWYDFLRAFILLPLQMTSRGRSTTRTTIFADHLRTNLQIFLNLKFYCMEQRQEHLDNMRDMGNRDNLDNVRRQLNTSTRGCASMDPERQRQIAREGGKAAHVKGTAHEFTSEEARNGGRKGGETGSKDRGHRAEIERKGGRSSSNNRKPNGEGYIL